VLQTFERIGEMKKRGMKMADIVSMIEQDGERSAGPFEPAQPGKAPAGERRHDNRRGIERRDSGNVVDILPAGGIRLTLDEVPGPAYLVNGKFELEWANGEASDMILGVNGGVSADITERNLFSLFFEGGPMSEMGGAMDLLAFHLGIAKQRLSKSALLTMDAELDDAAVDTLSRLYDETEAAEQGQILHTQVNLAPAEDSEQWHDVYASFFREGIFFAFGEVSAENDSLLAFLARRDIVIRDLLKNRKPYLTPMAVVVADLQNSVKICAELPPEEYFELINQVWGAVEPMLRKYYATHCKHVGDGMVYYFFPQPDSSYVLNAIRCAQEMKAIIGKISREWQKRKNWTNELMLNIGLVEGREWFGTYATPTHIEFTVLGDTINIAGRLSDFAREGSVWVTKNMVGQLTTKERETLTYGIRRQDQNGNEILVPNTYSRISNLVDLANPKYEKFNDIAVLTVAEILDVEMAA
jgi:class 3 adenylate cyclase